jgi:hypothetical protein
MSTKPWVVPWDPTYNSQSNPVPEDVVLPWLGDPTVTDFPPVITSDTPPIAPAPATPTTHAAVPTGSLGSVLEQELEAAVSAAQKAATAAVEAKVIAALKNAVPEAPAAPTLEPQDVTNAAARGRALRSLLYGLGLTIFWALVTAIGDAVSGGQVDFFTKTGWISVATLAAGTIAHAVLSYVGRIKFAPNSPE